MAVLLAGLQHGGDRDGGEGLSIACLPAWQIPRYILVDDQQFRSVLSSRPEARYAELLPYPYFSACLALIVILYVDIWNICIKRFV